MDVNDVQHLALAVGKVCSCSKSSLSWPVVKTHLTFFPFAWKGIATDTVHPSIAHMLGFFERQRLAKKGLAPHKTRRRVTESELLETLEHGAVAKFSLIGLFAVGLAWVLMWGGKTVPTTNLLVALLIYGTATAHLCLNRREVWSRNSRLLLLLLILFAHLASVKFCMLMAADAVR